MGVSVACWTRTAAFLAWHQPMNREPATALVNADGIGHSGPSGNQFLDLAGLRSLIRSKVPRYRAR